MSRLFTVEYRYRERKRSKMSAWCWTVVAASREEALDKVRARDDGFTDAHYPGGTWIGIDEGDDIVGSSYKEFRS